ncbi:MAG TPA: GNAT family N-acetyltransferase [Bacillota bacterium]|nr:GNAT family N-acetyltransferase [Bacillota bacterium]
MAQFKPVRIRPLKEEDLSAVARWNNDAEVGQYMDGPQPKTLEECRQWFADCRGSRNQRLFALETLEGKLLGELELDHISWRKREAELRICIGEKEYWNQGYGRAAVRALLDIAFEHLNLSRIYLRVYQANKRAINCYRKVGFRCRGRLRRLNDTQWRNLQLMDIDRETLAKVEDKQMVI